MNVSRTGSGHPLSMRHVLGSGCPSVRIGPSALDTASRGDTGDDCLNPVERAADWGPSATKHANLLVAQEGSSRTYAGPCPPASRSHINGASARTRKRRSSRRETRVRSRRQLHERCGAIHARGNDNESAAVQALPSGSSTRTRVETKNHAATIRGGLGSSTHARWTWNEARGERQGQLPSRTIHARMETTASLVSQRQRHSGTASDAAFGFTRNSAVVSMRRCDSPARGSDDDLDRDRPTQHRFIRVSAGATWRP